MAGVSAAFCSGLFPTLSKQANTLSTTVFIIIKGGKKTFFGKRKTQISAPLLHIFTHVKVKHSRSRNYSTKSKKRSE